MKIEKYTKSNMLHSMTSSLSETIKNHHNFLPTGWYHH